MKFFGLLKDGAVLQRGKNIVVKGFSQNDAVCTLNGGEYFKSIEIKPSKDGKFKVVFPPVTDVKSLFTLKLKDRAEEISITITFGDVYLTLGQSNMAYGAGCMYNRKELIKRAKKCNVKFFDIFEAYGQENGEIFRPEKPMDDFEGEWKWITPDDKNIGLTSAVALITAIELYEKTGVPIAMVNTALGGVSIDTYMPRDVADTDPRIIDYLKKIDKYIPANGKYNVYPGANYSQLGGIYNEKIHPLKDNFFKAALWYQGENAISGFEGAAYYEIALRKIILTYQEIFGKDLYFIATNVAFDFYDYSDYGYNYVNEAIARAVIGLNACSFPAYDASTEWKVNDGATYYHPIHPVNKDLIAHRFAKAVLSKIYGKKEWIPPYIADVKAENGKIYAEIYPKKNFKFKHIFGFTVAGKDGKFVQAECKVVSRGKIEIYSPYVKEPVEATYAFSPYNSRCNLICSDGDAVKTYRARFEDVKNRQYLPLNCFASLSELWFDEKNFGPDLGCIGKAEIFKDGLITRTNSTKRSIVSIRGENCLKAEFAPTNEGYYFFGISPEVNIPGVSPHFERFKYLSIVLKAKCAREIEFWGGLVRTAGGSIHRFVGENLIEKVNGEFTEYKLNLNEFVEPSLGRIPATEQKLSEINTFELYFRSKKKGVLYIKSIILHD